MKNLPPSFCLQSPGPGVSAPYRQSLDGVILQLSQLGFPSNFTNPFLQLLKHFDIGAIQDNR